MTAPLTRSTKLWYGLGQMAEGMKNESFALFLLFYYTQVIGLSGTLSGQAILLSLLSDAITDPLAGAISDRLHSRWGRRHPFMYASALPVAVTFYLAFAPPAGLGPTGLFAWLATFAILARFSITLFHVPHLALGAELSTNYEERTSIVTTRYTFARIGAALAGAVGLLVFMRPTPEYPHGQLNPAAYPPFAATLAVAIFAIILLSAWRTHSRIPYLAPPDAFAGQRGIWFSLLRDTAQALRNRSFRALFLGSTLSFTAWGITTALGLHLGTYFWQVTTDELVFWGIGTGIGVFGGLWYWNRAARREDKKQVFMRGLGLYTVLPLRLSFSSSPVAGPRWTARPISPAGS